MLPQVGGGVPRTSENEALIESSFRRLVASIEAEREKLRQTWQSIDEQTRVTGTELEKSRQDTEEACYAERLSVENEWKRLDRLREKMSVLYPNERGELLEINCSGRMFSIPKGALCCIEGSVLNHMFSDAFAHDIPRDPKGRFFLDFNPSCFAILAAYLQQAQHNPNVPAPTVPPELQQSMDIMAEALNLQIFLRPNRVQRRHHTSLSISSNTIESTHQGWQIISTEDPLPLSGSSYYEVRVVANPDALRGGLAIGVCGHRPTEREIFKIAMPDVIWYVSNNGLVAGKQDDKSVIVTENLQKKVQFKTGSTVGVKHDISSRSIRFFVNRISIGACTLNLDLLESFKVLYPVFGLYVAGQILQVDFGAVSPSAARGGAVSAERHAA